MVGVVGDALMGHFDGQGAFVFACIAGIIQKLVHGIGHGNLLGADHMASLAIILSRRLLVHKSDRVAIYTILLAFGSTIRYLTK
jgi:hypothetical protein